MYLINNTMAYLNHTINNPKLYNIINSYTINCINICILPLAPAKNILYKYIFIYTQL